MADELAQWLEGLGLGQYAEVFAENAIDFRSLPHLSEDDLRELGLPMGHRRILQAALAEPDGAASAPTTTQPDSPALEAERRQLTVMFCDLVGSTALSAGLDPEDMRAIIGAYHRCCADTIERHGGFVAKYMGDGVLAYFGYPNAHEHDAERAVQAGLALTNAVPRLATKAESPLRVRVGIATGLVVVGDLIGSGDAQERGVVGDTPNLAARLQSMAEPGKVVIADGTRRLLGKLFELEDLGAREIKGLDGTTRAWAALRESSVESRFEALRAPSSIALVGREEESELLLRRWSQVKSGDGQVVLLSGEAGIGKSHLTAALMARLSDEPHTRLRYFCSPQHVDSALHPVIVQIGRAARLEESDTTPARLDKLDRLLAGTSTSVEDATLLAEMMSLSNDGRYPTLEFPPPQRRQKTLRSLVTQLEALTRQGPVLMIYEDAHWTDPSSLELFGHVVNRISDLPILLIVTFRPEFSPPWIGQPHVTALTLNRLAERDAGAMIDRVIGNAPLPANIRQDIIERTDGVPLFVEEMTKAVLESESDSAAQRTATKVPSPTQAVPASLHASLMARLDRLGPAKEIIQIGAAIGREFFHPILAEVARKPEAKLAAAIGRLVEADLVSQHGVPPHASYMFKHALVQDAAYGLLLREPRQELHARIAASLESRFTDMAASEPEILAHHFSRADQAGRACVYFERAGDRSSARSAYAEAIAHFSAALAEVSNLAPGKDRDERELGIVLKQGQAVQILKGQRSPEVEQIYRRAYEIAKTSGDEEQVFKALWGMWLHANLMGKSNLARDRAEALVALGKESGKEELILEGIHCRWSTAFFRGDVAGTLADAGDGLKIYDPARHGGLGAEFGAHDPGVCAHTVSGFGHAQSGRWRAAADSAEKSIALSATLGHLPSEAFALSNALTSYHMIGDRAAVTRVAAQLSELAVKFDLGGAHAIARFMAGWASACGEQLAAGLQALEAEFPQVSEMTSMPLYHTGVLADLRLEAGRAAAALELLDQVLGALPEPGVGFYLPEIHRLRAECLFRLDHANFNKAEREFEVSIEVAKQQRAPAFQLAAAIGLAHACSSVGQPEKGVDPLNDAVAQFADDDVPPELASARQTLSGLRH